MTKPKRDPARTARRLRAADMRRAAKLDAATRQEARDEAISPAIQRNAVLDASGAVLRGARVQRDGVTFCRADPLRHIEGIAEAGGMFGKHHVQAARRLVTCWDEVGDGVGLGASDWGSLSGSRGTVPTIPSGYTALLAQVGQRLELEAVRTWLGALWPCLEDVALRGMGLAAWGLKAGVDRKAVPGYLLAGLDRLVEFYKAREPERRQKVRAVAVAERC